MVWNERDNTTGSVRSPLEEDTVGKEQEARGINKSRVCAFVGIVLSPGGS